MKSTVLFLTQNCNLFIEVSLKVLLKDFMFILWKHYVEIAQKNLPNCEQLLIKEAP